MPTCHMADGSPCGLPYGHRDHHRSVVAYTKQKGYYGRKATERRSALATLKLERGCADCGYNADPAALEFDHLRDKGFAVSQRLHSRPLEQILEEVEKCEVVCANCHRIRTEDRRAA